MSLDPEQVRDILRSEIEPLRHDIQRLQHALDGNGQPGLKTRVALLEQAESTRKVWVKAAVGTAMSSAIVALWAKITGNS